MMKYMRKHQTLEPIADVVAERTTLPVSSIMINAQQAKLTDPSSLSVNTTGLQAQLEHHLTIGSCLLRMISSMPATKPRG
jgi:hypothetical protein